MSIYFEHVHVSTKKRPKSISFSTVLINYANPFFSIKSRIHFLPARILRVRNWKISIVLVVKIISSAARIQHSLVIDVPPAIVLLNPSTV